MSNTKQFLCFDIGGTNVKYAILTDKGEFIDRGKYPTSCLDLDRFVGDMVDVINKYESGYSLHGVGISMPGFIDPKTGFSDRAGAIEALDGKNLKELLSSYTDLRIEIENDANCAALAEKFNGNATECNDFICYTIGTGIGGGIFVNGKIVNGHQFRAGEFGFMITTGMENGYQNLHDIASTRGLINAYKVHKGFPENEPVEGNQVFEEAKNDSDIQQVIDQWYERLSYGIYNLASVLNPEKILLGGAISVREDLYVELDKKLKKIPKWDYIEVKIEPCRHRNDAGLLGALYLLVQ